MGRLNLRQFEKHLKVAAPAARRLARVSRPPGALLPGDGRLSSFGCEHTGEFVEFEQLKKLHGRVLKVEPWPLTRTGRLLVTTQHNQWKIMLASSRLVVLTSAATAHHLEVEAERILNFRPPDRLLLDGQLILEGAKVSLSPRRPSQENP